MNQNKRKSRFEDNQSGYHRSAVNILAGWVNGSPEEKFYLHDEIYFVPDVTVYMNGEPSVIYEVVYKNEFTGKKLGRIQFWCYVNAFDLKVCEVSAHWILKQTKKPEKIETENQFSITVF